MIEEFFKTEREAINLKLKTYFNDLNHNEKEVLFADFYKQLKKFIIPKNSKAKRLHSILMIASFSGIINPIYLNEEIDKIREISLAVELLHSGHLIHDDLIDDDNTRRGIPTFHIQLKNEIEKVYKTMDLDKEEELYSQNISILGGTFGYFLGLDVLKSSKFPDKLKLSAINEYTEAIEYLMKGMIIEEYMLYNNITMTLEQYLTIAEMQRARVFEKSTKIGAILARGNFRYQIEPLSEAMLRIGQAHAIRDDILDMKEDIRDKKKKFLYILAVQNTNEEQSKILNEIYRLPKLTKSNVKEVENIFIETNAMIIAEQFSKGLIQEAKRYLTNIYPDLNKEQKVFFNEFSDYIYLRDF
ncbi:MAG: polyprenyl synthetase family protein [Promethearchaeota archaeon]